MPKIRDYFILTLAMLPKKPLRTEFEKSRNKKTAFVLQQKTQK